MRQKGGDVKTEKAYVFDFTDIENNEFLAVNQFTIVENGKERRPDIVVFINGLPLAVVELKNASNEDVGIEEGFHQLQTYKTGMPPLL